MPMWQVWGNWPDKSPGVPRVVKASWVTPPSESGRPSCAWGGVRLGSGQALPALDPRLETQRNSLSQLDFSFPLHPVPHELISEPEAQAPFGVGVGDP